MTTVRAEPIRTSLAIPVGVAEFRHVVVVGQGDSTVAYEMPASRAVGSEKQPVKAIAPRAVIVVQVRCIFRVPRKMNGAIRIDIRNESKGILAGWRCVNRWLSFSSYWSG